MMQPPYLNQRIKDCGSKIINPTNQIKIQIPKQANVSIIYLPPLKFDIHKH